MDIGAFMSGVATTLIVELVALGVLIWRKM